MTPLLRGFGALLIVAAAVGYAFSNVARERKKLDTLDAWIELISYLRLQIDCYLMPVDRILKTADKELLARLGARGNETPARLLSRTLPLLDTESGKEIGAFLSSLGGAYRAEELKSCDYHLARLRAHREKLAGVLPSRIRMSVTLTVCAATASVILLW